MDSRNYSAFTAYDTKRDASNQWAFPDEIVNQYAANIMGNQFVVPPNGPTIHISGADSYFVLNSTYLGSPGYIKYIFASPITLKQSYSMVEMGQFEPMNTTTFYPVESTIEYGVSKPSIHNLRVHPFKWDATRQVLMAISLTYTAHNQVRTDEFILPYRLEGNTYTVEGAVAYPKAVYTNKVSNVVQPYGLTGLQGLKVVF